MHAAPFRPRMSEEAFQVLLDVIDTHLAALRLPEVNSNEKKRKRFRNCHQTKNAGQFLSRQPRSPDHDSTNLITRYRCESRFIENLNATRISIAEILRVDHQGGITIRTIVVPLPRILRDTVSCEENSSKRIKIMNDSCEPMEIEEIIAMEAKNTQTASGEANMADDSELSMRLSSQLAVNPANSKKIIREPKLVIGSGAPASIKTEDCKASGRLKTGNGRFVERPDYVQTKLKLRALIVSEKEKRETERGSIFFFWQMLFFILFPMTMLIAGVCIFREDADMESCTRNCDFSNAITSLQDHIFGQTFAVEELSRHLPMNSSEFKVLALIGGGGVGKSWAAHLISKNFPRKKNVFHYVQPLSSEQRRATAVLSVCGCNLIILENLSPNDIPDTVNFVGHVREEAKDHCVIILPVINVQQTDSNLRHSIDLDKSRADIELAFRNENLPVRVIEFQPLDDRIVRRCILDAAEQRNIDLLPEEVDYIAKSLEMADSGCKGAYAKVQLFEKNISHSIN